MGVDLSVRTQGKRDQLGERMIEDSLRVVAKVGSEVLHQLPQQQVIVISQWDPPDLSSQLIVGQLASNIHDAAVHAGSDEIGGVPGARAKGESQYDQHATGHVLSQKMLCCPADDDRRAFPFVLFQVDGHSLADVVADEDLSPTHRVSGGVTCPPMNDHLAIVHGVATAVLRIPAHDDARPVQKSRQIVARRTVDVNFDRAMQVGAYVTLTADILQVDALYPIHHGLAQLSVQVAIVNPRGINLKT